MKPTLRLGFADTCLDKFFLDLFGEKYDIVVDNDRPDYLIFGDENFGTRNRSFSKQDCIKIFYTGENRRAENYDCHYSIDFDQRPEPWHFRLTGAYATRYWYNKYNQNTLLLSHTVQYPKDRFCLFVHRNGGCVERNIFFNLLSSYKKIDAAGPLFHNTDFMIGSEYDEKIELAKRYKFVMAFENGSYPGYVTEKIVDAFYAGAVPIYWGSSTVGDDFNPLSYINVGSDFSRDAFINAAQKVIQLDQDDALYNSYLVQPKLTDEKKYLGVFNDLRDWFENTVFQKKDMRI